MRRLFCSLLLILMFPLAVQAAVSDISRIYRQPYSLQDFEVCFGGGCFESKHINLTAEEWQKISQIFAILPATAEQERRLVAQAIGMLEVLVGQKTGTATDRAGTFDNSKYPGQLDCNDEAINTTTYLRLLQQQGLLKFHAIEDMRTRNFFFTGWPHTTAVIHDTVSGQRYAVDSWFYDNGHAATIVPFEQWKSNYYPEDSPIVHERSN